MPLELDLIRPGTKLTANGEGDPRDISASATRTFMCWIEITDQLEQESVDVSVYGSEDGQTWGKMPLLKMPQRFYRGDTNQILDLSMKPEIRFLRAKWELARWGRVAPHPMFVLGFRLTEVPAFVNQAAASTRPRGMIARRSSSTALNRHSSNSGIRQLASSSANALRQ